MNEKEIAEIRRRFNINKSNINHIRGCCVGSEKQILAEFDQSMAFLTEDESAQILSVIKKTLSGYIGKNLVDIEFSTKQVLESEEHKVLMDIRQSTLSDDAAVHTLYEKIIASVEMEGNYIILLASDKYDVLSHGVDGEKNGDSNEVFTYFICCVCPLKTSRSQLGFYVSGNPFRSVSADTVVTMPEMGFMFPTFDDRTANIYKALYYTKNTEKDRSAFIESVFNAEFIPMPADVQKQTINSMIENTVSDDCTLHVVKTIHNQINEMIEESKEHRDEDPLMIDKNKLREVLESSGLDGETVSAFEENFTKEFGERTQISPRNIVETRSFQLKTPDVVIKVNPKRTDLVKTRIIDGEKYILISADENVEVNGVNINI